MSGELADIDGVGQAELVARGDVTATDLVAAAIERIEALNPALNAVVYESFDEALARAATNPAGPFGGVPYLLKDLVVERAGTPFTEGSRFLEGNVSAFTSELATRLERARRTHGALRGSDRRECWVKTGAPAPVSPRSSPW